MEISIRHLLLLVFLMFSGCENYVELDEINACFSKNDLGIKFKILVDSEHEFQIELLKKDNPDSFCPILIKVGNKFQISSGLVSVKEGAKYKIKMVLSENTTKPILLYSFWESPITELRYRTFNGENGNPPESKTQKTLSELKIFEEIFKINKNENFIMLRLFCEKGKVIINEISIEEIT